MNTVNFPEAKEFVYIKREKPTAILAFFFFLCIFSAHQLFSQSNPEFNHITVENGLSQSTVYAITQDSKGFIWFASRDGLNRYDSRNIKVYKNITGDKSSLSGNLVTCLLSDSKGNLWIGTANGLNKYNRNLETFTRLLQEQDQVKCNISQIYEDRKGNLWIGTNRGLYFKGVTSDNIRLLSFSTYRHKQSWKEVLTIKEDHKANIWIGTDNGLFKMNTKGKVDIYRNSTDPKYNYIRTITQDEKHNLWVGTDGGLQYVDSSSITLVSKRNKHPVVSKSVRKIMISKTGKIWLGTSNGILVYNQTSGTLKSFVNDPGDSKSLNQNSVYDIYEDKAGTIWIGTFYGGVNYILKYPPNFIAYQKRNDANALESNIISGIAEDDNHNLLVGTQEAGLNYYDRTTGKFLSYKSRDGDANSLSSDIVKLIYKDSKGNIWVGSHYLQLYNQQTKSFKTFKNKINQPAFINAICEYKNNTYWVGVRDGGIYLFDYSTETVVSADSITGGRFKNKVIKYIFKDVSANIWFGTDAGLFLLNGKTGEIEKYESRPPGQGTLGSDNINVISQDRKQRIWVGTASGGLSLFDRANRKVTNFTVKDGLPSNTINGLLADDYGYLWLSTDKGLCRFDSEKYTTRNYNIQDGLPGIVFNLNSFLKDHQGNFFFGGYNGLVQFNPSNISANDEVADLHFLDIHVANELNSANKYISQLTKPLPSVAFSYRQNVFTVDFALLNYVRPLKNKYAYQLLGYEKGWTYVNVPSATFTNVPAGEYTLLVKGANNDGKWTAEPIRLGISISPPPWLSWWAYLFYFIIASGIALIIVRFIVIRDRLKREEQIHQMKLDFFTNISHELRTPLTLILGPIESIIKSAEADTKIKNKLSQAKFNVDRLLRLVGELLDFRKTETGNLEIHVAKHNIVSFARKIFLSFDDFAEKRSIDYKFIAEKQDIDLYFDDVQLEKVLYNILSNAFKFTTQGGKITLEIIADQSDVLIKISDNGIGIPSHSLSKIFTNYYQVKDYGQQSLGSGIGLALSKSIIELHHGAISVASRQAEHTEERLTCFTILMKTGSAHFSANEMLPDRISNLPLAPKLTDTLPDTDSMPGIDGKKFDILIAEDNDAIRKFIAENLSGNFNITQCANGQEGLDAAFRNIPDLIISDVMMPEMDGLEFSKKIKEDDRTSHIPLILLTALSDTIHQIEGLQMGADLYLSKPFSIQVLELSINNLLASRDLMRRKFSQEYTLQPSNVVIDSKDDAFLNKLVNCIELNMTNNDFSVDKLAVDMGMSRNVLYRKIDALTGMSVNDFIKSIRLKRALQLLESQEYAVYEVATLVGFNDHKYFSKEFKKCFGKSPSEFKVIK
ncbi:hybrid sensor histidine kinase/response regulator transcription factor [Desertivirga xinjiangensis]|uniref:hybrid sensor histidine kinase/response regulator transcription factor n=1 Tax=Desertivirga xinjiangensis TaxID=539206 RepID=UPI00210B3DAF|nr:hybrid sensor histidine kinase/response regulator transcription factor [Pedobacter xinjiangensis]